MVRNGTATAEGKFGRARVGRVPVMSIDSRQVMECPKGRHMYELETQAGTVFSRTESLADAMAECLAAEQRTRTASLYEAVEAGLEDAPMAEVLQMPVRVA